MSKKDIAGNKGNSIGSGLAGKPVSRGVAMDHANVNPQPTKPRPANLVNPPKSDKK